MKIIIISVLLSVLTSAEIENVDVSNFKDLAVNLNVSNLPQNLDDFKLPEGSVDKYEAKLKEKCERVGGEQAFVKFKEAQPKLIACVQGLINVTQIQAEIEEAKPKGNLDTVFRSYCAKTPELRSCVVEFMDTAKGCLTQQEINSTNSLQKIIDAWLEFICFKEGDRIALFIAEGGPECINKTSVEIAQCVNSTMGHIVPNNSVEEAIPTFTIGEKECGYLGDLKLCVVNALEKKCSEHTPANIVDSLFKFTINNSPCAEYFKVNSASTLNFSLASTLLLAIGAMILSVQN